MAKRTRKFKTEVQQLLDLVIHSLYSKKEIFLRELISNASDAIDRAKFEALTDKALLKEETEWKIKLHVDKEARTLTLSDNGIGMTAEEVETNIGTIANSGTRRFLENLKDADTANPELIGQFGVGFYASFMVADKVTLVTRRAGEDQAAVKWISQGAGNYTLEEGEREGHGTDVTLHLREDMDQYLEEWELRKTVKEYSDYIDTPIVMDVVRTQKSEEEGGEDVETIEEETLNSMKAIWRKAKNDVSKEEYNEFYKHVSHDYTDPLKVIHYAAEGTTEFRALLYLPSQAPMDLYMPERKTGVHLYVKNVFITDNCTELVPEFLRFLRGVVDSSDLPLNISREMLQDDVIIRRIRKSIVSKVLASLKALKRKGKKDYLAFYDPFGKVLKEGLHFDRENADKLKELVLFHSTADESEQTFLAEYVERMPEDQKEIYYLTADSLETAQHSPHLEMLKSRGFEVLLMVDTIDEWVLPHLTEYEGKTLKSIDRGDLDLDGKKDDGEDKDEDSKEEETSDFDGLLKFMGETLADDVKEVRISKRLTESACCLVADEFGMNPHMERIMRSMNQEVPETKRILEVNPEHPILARLKTMQEADAKDAKLLDYVGMLYDQALIAEGAAPRNPKTFTKLLSELIVAVG